MRIEDGRLSFFQWDINQRLLIDNEDIKEVHFSNAFTQYALVCEVFVENGKRLVNVPNILLQTEWTIKAYGWCDNCVKAAESYVVQAREKPEDYIYTETEVKRFDELEARIEELEKNGGTGGGAVSSVNGKVGEVELKAADVGAVPTSRTVNNKALSSNITLTASDIGAIGLSGGTLTGSLNIGSTSNTSMYSVNLRKKVSDTQYVTGSLAMNGSDLRIQNSVSTKRSGTTTSYTTTSNSVVISDSETSVSKPILFTTTAAKEDTRESLSVYSKAEVDTAISEATKENKFELIETITIEEEGITVIEKTEINGENYKYSELWLEVITNNIEKAQSIAKQIYTQSKANYPISYRNDTHAAGDTKRVSAIGAIQHNGMWFGVTRAVSTAGSGGSLALDWRERGGYLVAEDDYINKVRINETSGTGFAVGTVINIMGVRA